MSAIKYFNKVNFLKFAFWNEYLAGSCSEETGCL